MYPYSAEIQGHLRDYLRVMYKRRMVMAAVILALIVLVGVASFLMRPIYKSTAQILIEKENPNVVGIQEVMALEASDTSYYQTQYKILQSRSLARKVIDELRLADLAEFQATNGRGLFGWKLGGKRVSADGLNESDIIDLFLDKLEIEPIRNSRLVEVSFFSGNAELAAQVANAVADKYVEQDLEARLEASQQAVGWLNEQVAEIRKKVEESERTVQEYKERNGLIGFDEKQNIVVQRLADLNRAVTEVETQRITIETVYRQLQELARNPAVINTLPAVIQNRLIQDLKVAYVNLQAENSKLAAKFGPKHPEMIRITSQLKLMEEKIRAEVADIVSSVQTEYQVALSRERSMVAALNGQKKAAQDLNEKAIRYSELQRDADSNKQLYDALLKRMKETGVTTALRVSNIRIVDKAEVPQFPVKPKKKMNILLSLFAGLLLGTGLAFFLEYLDNTVKTPDDLSRYVGIPFLGPVPLIETEEGKSKVGPGVFEQQRSSAAEAYRSLRTSLLFSSSESPPKAALVTSALPMEGKTTTAINLAYAFAYSDKRVVLVDCDMRKPGLHRELGLSNEVGLTNYIVGTASLEEILQPTEQPGLEVITCGPLPPNPSELLGSARMSQLVEELKSRYDHIIIDSAPVMAVTDPVVVSKTVDGVVLVIKAMVTNREAVRNSKKQLGDVGTKILGAVLNQIDTRKEGYYYYTYYYRYYDYYGGREQKSASRGSKSRPVN